MSDPNRPEHPDFWIISEAVIDGDASVANGSYEDAVRRVVDLGSAIYMGKQRTSRLNEMEELGLTSTQMSALRAAWVDGFIAGAEYRRIKTERERPNFPPGRGKQYG